MPAAQSLTLVVAMDRQRAIGRDGGLPWHLPADLRHFKRTTLGHAVIMGRKTYDEVGRPLPGRQNIVLSRQLKLAPPGCELAQDLAQALALAKSAEVMIIGGGEIYALCLPLASRLVVTRVAVTVAAADTWFPALDENHWLGQLTLAQAVDDRHQYAFEVRDYRPRLLDGGRLCRVPTAGGRPVRIEYGEFERLRKLLLRVIPADPPGLQYKALMTKVAAATPPQARGGASWRALRVKLELEASGALRRLNGRSPQRLIRSRSMS